MGRLKRGILRKQLSFPDDLFPIKISRSMKCLHKLYNRAVALDRISDSQMVVKVVVEHQLVVVELILRIIMMMMTFIVKFFVQKQISICIYYNLVFFLYEKYFLV